MNTEKVRLGGGKKAFPKEIIYLRGNANYTKVYLNNGKQFLVATHLKIIENRLLNHRFFRVHKSSLVNLDFVKSYENMPQKGIVMLQNNELIEVSRRRNKMLRNILIIQS